MEVEWPIWARTALLDRGFVFPLWPISGKMQLILNLPLMATSGGSVHRDLRLLHPQLRT